MCGVAGAVALQGREEVSRTLVQRIVESQRQRGPDFQATAEIPVPEATVVLGHDRLSIIDLSQAGNQPMWDRDGRLAIVFNGEIYNFLELKEELSQKGHSFTSRSDTEVLLEAFKCWGVRALDRLNGMFAFGIFDSENRTLWLARDRFGVKPLYCFWNEDCFCFASTPAAIARHFGLRPNLAYLARGMRYWVYEDDSAQSPYEGIHSCRPGSYLHVQWDRSGFRVASSSYYDLGTRAEALRTETEGNPEHRRLAAVEETLESAVRIRLRADVQVGVSLSGGVDSSAIAALAARAQRVTAFSFGHPDIRDTEGPVVRELSRHIPVEVVYVWPTPERFVEGYLQTLEAQDAPFPNLSILAQFLVFQEARSQGFKVLLGGQGGDEAFMGYRKYLFFRLAQLWKSRDPGVASFIWQLLPTLLAETPDAREYWSSLHRYVKKSSTTTLYAGIPCEAAELGYDPRHELWRRQVLDVTRFSLPTLLRYEDRNSMGNSVESRLPLMDYRVVELGLSLPDNLKIRKGFGKWALRKIAQKHVPRCITYARYKKGFNVNAMRWIEGGLGAVIRGQLHRHTSKLRQLGLPADGIEDRFSDRRLANHSTALHEAISLTWLGSRLP